MESKICTACKIEKELERGFAKRVNYNKSSKTYYMSHCKECNIAKVKAWQSKNREEYNKYQRERHYRLNREAGKAVRKPESTGRVDKSVLITATELL